VAAAGPDPRPRLSGLWTRQHRFPTAELVVVDQGVTATVAAMAGAGLADYQQAAGYLADTWGCVTVRAEQQAPGLIRLRGLYYDPLRAPARVDLPGVAPASLESWWLTSSLPWNHREPLCGPPFPQVALDRRGRSYRFS
jgi:hypothetical protein